MELKDKVVVITGAGSGIGRAMAVRFKQEGAKHIVAVDINKENVQATADSLGCHAMTADVSSESDMIRVIEETEANWGPIDLFCSNAGVGVASTLDASNEEWQKSWDINVMAHVYIARHLVPRMLARGGGYFLITSSAAGLLNQIGGASYGVTKHAAVGFGEWLAMHYQHRGIKVSMLCPQAVRTAMTTSAEAQGSAQLQSASVDGMMDPQEVMESVVQGLTDESFLILPHPEVLDYIRGKTANYDRWIGGMNKLMRSLMGESN